jgi:hypothetical protein
MMWDIILWDFFSPTVLLFPWSVSHQQISSTNSDDNFLILGWGAGGGERKRGSSEKKAGTKKGRKRGGVAPL